MEILPNSAPQHGFSSVHVTQITDEKRTRMSGPAMRGFANLAELWDLNTHARLVALGALPRSTYYKWQRQAEEHEGFTLPLDVLLRISAMLGIHKALRTIFTDAEEGVRWLKYPNEGVAFGGQSPLDIILSGSQDGIMHVRRFLDAWRGGLFSAPIKEDDFAVDPDDIVIIGKDGNVQ